MANLLWKLSQLPSSLPGAGVRKTVIAYNRATSSYKIQFTISARICNNFVNISPVDENVPKACLRDVDYPEAIGREK
jgi:hypothetical protein